jgi:hypothetical protein
MTPLINPANVNGQDLAIRSDVLAGIRQASLSTGIDFSYLMAQANRESSFDPAAQAQTSSASGLYQFVEQTWLGVVKNHGAEYGQGDLADKISRRADGHFAVADSALRKEILELRRDPGFSSAMAAEHAADNEAKLQEKLGREINGTDLYMAHFLGISGALKFLRNVAESPDKTGASMFPKAAAANQDVFYTENGRARTVSEIYDKFGASMNADMQTYAALESPATPAAAGDVMTVADAGIAFPSRPNAAYLAAFRTVSTDSGSASVPATSGLSKMGSLLSPLMLVTLAALPVGREADEQDDKNTHRVELSDGQGLTNSRELKKAAQDGSLFSRTDDPLHLELLRSSYAI